MRTLYIECRMGAAGDMLMGALLELHPNPDAFLQKLNNLGIPKVEVTVEKRAKLGIMGSNVHVSVDGEEEVSRDYHGHDHDHHHHHDHDHDHHHEYDHHYGDLSTLPDVTEVIMGLDIPEKIKQQALGVYQLIAEAEAKAHGRDVAQVHFHEVGALDAVTDIVGNCLLLADLAVDQIIVSPIHVGSGLVKCAHGILPVPAPATAHILQGVPTYGGDIQGELCTPTGAAILKFFGQAYGPQPVMTVDAIGYGVGKKDFPVANVIRVFHGQTEDQGDRVVELACNLDDMTAEEIGYVMERLLEAGALDVYLTAIQMKKQRPGTMLTCLCQPSDKDDFVRLLMKQTTTLGVRWQVLDRYTMDRKQSQLETPWGEIGLKEATGYGVTKRKFELDDLARIAREHDWSLMELKQRINQLIEMGGNHE